MKKLLLIPITLTCVALLIAFRASSDLPGVIDDGDGHRLRIRDQGQGSPVVVMEIGLGGPLEEWTMVQRDVATFTRVVSYDRLASHRTEKVLTGRQIAVEFHTALANAHVPPPYILVGQSFAGVYNRIFAAMYPDEVAGMVLLDPTTKEFVDWMEIHHPEEGPRSFHTEDFPEAAGIIPTFEELDGCPPPPNVPVVVVTGAKRHPDKLFQEVFPVWVHAHEHLASSLPQGRHVITDKSGHGIHVEQPVLVVQLIREVFDQVRKQQSR
jgi:pimeloyl-ACP methyl ester carboxylesterase